MQTARELGQLAARLHRVGERVAQHLGLGARRVRAAERHPQLERERDHVLVRALVQRALEPAPHLVALLEQSRARGRELLPRRVVDQRLRDELGEPREPVLTARRQLLLVGDRGDERPPDLVLEEDRRGDRGAHAERAHDRRQLAARAVVARDTRRTRVDLRAARARSPGGGNRARR